MHMLNAHKPSSCHEIYQIFTTCNLLQAFLTLGAHAPEGYGSCPVCVSVCLSATLIWELGLVEV